MGDLTEHFSEWEFASKDGAPMPDAVRAEVPKTCAMLEKLRAAVSAAVGHDCPLDVLSGYRSPAHNAAVGGVSNSYHLRGQAADVVSRHASPGFIQTVAHRLQELGIIGGVGAYLGFTHVDTGPRRSWTQAIRAAHGGAQ